MEFNITVKCVGWIRKGICHKGLQKKKKKNHASDSAKSCNIAKFKQICIFSGGQIC